MKRRLSSAKKAYNLLAPQQTTAGPSPVPSWPLNKQQLAPPPSPPQKGGA